MKMSESFLERYLALLLHYHVLVVTKSTGSFAQGDKWYDSTAYPRWWAHNDVKIQMLLVEMSRCRIEMTLEEVQFADEFKKFL